MITPDTYPGYSEILEFEGMLYSVLVTSCSRMLQTDSDEFTGPETEGRMGDVQKGGESPSNVL